MPSPLVSITDSESGEIVYFRAMVGRRRFDSTLRVEVTTAPGSARALRRVGCVLLPVTLEYLFTPFISIRIGFYCTHNMYHMSVFVNDHDHSCDGRLAQSVLLARHSSMCALISALSAFDENS